MAKGFTLIELITVLVILGIISVFAVPRLSGAEAFSVTGARDTGLSVARQVQLRAMQQESAAGCNALVITASRLGAVSPQNPVNWERMITAAMWLTFPIHPSAFRLSKPCILIYWVARLTQTTSVYVPQKTASSPLNKVTARPASA